ncbi:hypothetical protein AOLI_G00312590 [Acnodon oligacanthus]
MDAGQGGDWREALPRNAEGGHGFDPLFQLLPKAPLSLHRGISSAYGTGRKGRQLYHYDTLDHSSQTCLLTSYISAPAGSRAFSQFKD